MTLLTAPTLSAQMIEEDATVKNKYTLAGERIRVGGMMKLMQDQPVALGKLQEARGRKIISYGTAFAGGWALGTLAGKVITGEYSDALIDDIGLSAGLLVATMLFDSAANRKIREGVKLYNDTQTNGSVTRSGPSLGLLLTGQRAGVRVTF